MDPRQALKSFRDKSIEGHDLLRVLTSHKSWRMLAIREGEGVRPLLRVVDDARWLQLFTDETAFNEHISARGEQSSGHDWVETTGEWVFGNLSDDLAGIDINPMLDDAIHYKKAQFPLLRDWAGLLEVERVLTEQDASKEAASRLANGKFYIAFIQGDQGAQLALAPDPEQKRQFAAVFTAPDAALRYTRQASAALKRELKLNVLAGHVLFSRLSQMPLDGIVFNCVGPTAPTAVSQDFARAFAEE
ncbi:MAG: hypothetical protein ACI8S6_002923 [Myxococcota bacterium]|jgi:hypothetical protein